MNVIFKKINAQKSAEIIRPLLRGRDIKRYSYNFADLYIITTFPSLKIDIEKYPSIKQHLISFGYDRLKQTGDKGARKKTNNKWFETQDSISYWEDFYRQKIVWKIIGSNISFLIDSNSFFYNNAANILTSNSVSLETLIAFLNSKLFEWYFKKIVFIEVEGGGIQMFNTIMEKIPVPQLKKEQKEKFIKKVKILSENKIKNHATEVLDKQINSLIYDVIGLELEEIEFIEVQ
ncbi:type II restriction endonuclease [Chryseobacterium indologenes]|uniref:TaqI-like C-terminal specificity domain-containing protein n=1 Tax=Chryseobacterium indologenes TaxID=253 RepID=UPI000F4FADF6|nr:TaqI-like C-terminal specificity domain-containing protein [Chryseobacterium indologenes]AYZ35029.1 type II restriction endonuclease [Chryseobacterium indologenes]MBF6643776.1 type II restriction endonuclease [Chryseobacterium indologenes]